MDRNSWKKLEPATFLALVAMLIALLSESAFAQSNIVPDETLGEESSQVRTDEVKGNPAEVIEGGAQQGANLFHSFSEFNVENGRGAYFANPTAIENIFSRVTGSNPSEILGTLGVSGNADLFLINPNGIIFGENARLDVGGSFVGTTADEVRFGETGMFSATEPETSNLLTINPSALFFNAMGAGEIINRSQALGVGGETNSVGFAVGLQVPSGQTLALVGGDVFLEAGNLTAAGGRVELGSVAGVGEVSLTQSDNNWEFEYDKANALGDIRLQEGAIVDASGAGGGNTQIQSARFEMLGSSFLLAYTLGSGAGGDVRIETEQLNVRDGAGISASTYGTGDAGNVTIDTDDTVDFTKGLIFSTVEAGGVGDAGTVTINSGSLNLNDGARVNASTSGQGNAGQITINTDGAVSLDGVNGLPTALLSNVEEGASGNSGGVDIVADSLSLSNGALVESRTRGNGNAADINLQAREITFTGMKDGWNSGVYSTVEEGAKGQGGNVHINTGALLLQDGGSITTDTNDIGDAGNITIDTDNTVDLTKGLIFSTVKPGGVGNGGTVTINSGSLSLADRGSITTSTYGTGDAGNVTINADDTVDLTEGFIFSTVEAGGVGDGGTVTINSGSLSLADGGQIQTLVRGIDRAEVGGNGNAGSIIINADEAVTISGNSSAIFSELGAGTEGNAGNIEIQVKGSLNLNDGARVNASTSGQGNAGNLTVTSDRLTLQNQGQLTVSGQGNSNPGNLTITANNITLDNQSIIEANTESGTQGNITFNTNNLLTLLRESKISTDATGTATGGNITINADDGFIIAVPEENSDITANATQAEGGRVFVDATNLYGIEFREQLTPQSDITASSELGPEFSGTVEINTPDVDPNRDLVQLPNQPTETEVVQACVPSDSKEQSEFIITGRGGLPPSPEDTLDSDALAVDWVTRQATPRASHALGNAPDPLGQPRAHSPSEVSTDSITPEPAPIIEAQGWIVDQNNQIVLIAHTPNSTWHNSPQCQKKAETRRQKYHMRWRSKSEGLSGIPWDKSIISEAKRQKAKVHNYSLLPNNSEPNILIASTKPKSITTKVPERIIVNSFKIKGNTVFENSELAQKLASFTNKSLSFAELLQARTTISEYYTKRGYLTSGAYIPLQKLQDKVVTIEVVEGYLEDIQITGNKKLNSDYVSSRIKTATEDSLQQQELLAALQLLQQDPLIDSLSAELTAGTRAGASVLEVEVREANSFTTPILLDNRRAPSVGSFRRQFAINEGNLLGFGDNLFLAYSNTEGSDAFDGSYAFPFNASNGTITVRGGVSSSEVVEEPFNQLNILGDSHYYELSLRQPLVRTPTQEFAIGITASRRNSDISSLLDEFNVPPSELSPGANEDGQTQVSALRLFQEWTQRNSREVIAARSEFSLGLDVFDATVNEEAPDSRFFAWQGQAQWTRQLARDTLFLLRGGIQLATTSLLPSEQFGLGGLETLRGYRQDLLLSDNAVFASAEIRLPIFRIRALNSVVQLAPFLDLGAGWNNGSEREVAEQNTLASIGLGLRLSLFNSLVARFDWGIPLISVDTKENTWQENGLYFSVEYSPF